MKQAMSKRILCLFLALIMSLGLLPMGVLAEGLTPPETVTIYFTMSIKGALQLSKNGTDGLARLPMEIPVGTTVVEALKEAHRQHYVTGESGYTESGGYFSKFWGVTTYNSGYLINGTMAEPTAVLSAGDALEAFIYQNTSDLYTRFNKQELTLATNQTTELTLLYNTISGSVWPSGMMGGESATLPLSGASILTDKGIASHIPSDRSNAWLTDANGKVSVSFDNPGTYYLSAAKENATLIPAIFKITVEDQATLDKAVSDDKAALNFDSIKGANTASNAVTQALVLPTSGQGGKTAIRWASDKTNFIKNDGTVLRPAARSIAEQVTLTATISYGLITDTKTILVTVPAFTPEEVTAENNFLQAVSDALTFDTIRKANLRSDEVTTDLIKPQAAIKSGDAITFQTAAAAPHVGASITWSSSNPPVISNDLMVTRQAEDVPLSLTATMTSPRFSNCPDVRPLPKTFSLTVPATDIALLLDNTAAYYAQKPAAWWGSASNGSWWLSLAMQAYGASTGGSKNVLSPEAKQTFANRTIAAISAGNASASELAKLLSTGINGLCAMGCDPTSLWTVNKTKLDPVSMLETIKLEDAKKDSYYYFTAPYVLVALQQGNFGSASQEEAHVTYLLEELKKPQAYIDSCAMMLHGLSYYYQKLEVKTAVDKAISDLALKQGDNGSYGNANSDAMVILALSQLGIRADSDAQFIKHGNSLLDGLLRYKASSNDGFALAGSTARNEYATQQGFLALIAASEVISTGTAYDAFSCTALPKSPAYANGSGSAETPSSPPVENKDLTVSLSVKVGNQTWLPSTAVTLKEGASVYHALTRVLADAGFSSEGAETGYVKSITNSGGTKLSEYAQGPNSGWLYKVNGRLPDTDLISCKVSNRDQIVWYFTNDWTKDEAASQVGSGGVTPTPVPPTSDTIETVTPSTTVSNGTATATVSTVEAKLALESVKKNKGTELVIAPVITGDVNTVAVSLPKDTLAALATDTKAALTVKSDVASISLSTAALSTISAESGSNVSISAEKADASKMSKANQALVGDHPVYHFSVTVGSTAVTDFKGAVTVALPYTLKAGEEPQKLTIYYIDPAGKATEMPGVRYDSATKSITFETTHFSTFAVAYDESKLVFTDVSPRDWFYPAVKFTLANKLFLGTSDQTFSPKAEMSRAMLFTVLHRMSGTIPEQAAEPWYSAGMAWAKTAGISDATNPNGSITREQLVTMLYRYASFKGYDASKTAELSSYSDGREVSSWAQKAMAWAVGEGLITGRTSTTLAPQGSATRAEVALIIQRFMACVLS